MNTISEPHVRLEPAVSEAWLRRVVLAGHSPNDFASWVLRKVDIDEMLRDYDGASKGGARVDEPAARGSVTSMESAETAQAGSTVSSTTQDRQDRWTKERFFAFLDFVTSVEDLVASCRLLGAYLRLGPIPTSESLKELCGFADEEEWQTALRVAKQRLTIQARRMDGPPLFRRAKAGKEAGQRLHPIEPLLFGWLKDWGSERTTTDHPQDALPDPERWGWELSNGANEEE